jgi:hypothetical protein
MFGQVVVKRHFQMSKSVINASIGNPGETLAGSRLKHSRATFLAHIFATRSAYCREIYYRPTTAEELTQEIERRRVYGLG